VLGCWGVGVLGIEKEYLLPNRGLLITSSGVNLR